MSNATDTVFDGIADTFEREVYGTTKGEIRLAVLWADLLESIPVLADGGLDILDAGGGSGHVAVRLASLGNRVTLLEPSFDMLSLAQTRAAEAGIVDRVTFVESTVQAFAGRSTEIYDVVLCHAVLEWVAEPQQVVRELAGRVRPGGSLSLLLQPECSAPEAGAGGRAR
jgi:S-adenosylmethionine-dependent methyltransferase